MKICCGLCLDCRTDKLSHIMAKVLVFVQNHVDLACGWPAADSSGNFVDLVPLVHREATLALGQEELLVGREGEDMYRPRQVHLPRGRIDNNSALATVERYRRNDRCRGCPHGDGSREQS